MAGSLREIQAKIASTKKTSQNYRGHANGFMLQN
mgnify:CR=1 FL=1